MGDDASTPKRRARKGTRGALTPELLESLLDHLTRGVFRTNACALIGIDSRTLEIWMRKGRDELADACEEMDTTGRMPRLSRYGELVARVEAVEAAVESDMLGVVVRVARLIEPEVARTVNPDGSETVVVISPAQPEAAFKAATWYLERKRHLVYGRGALRVDIGPTSPSGDEDEDPAELFLDRLAAVEKNVRAALGLNAAEAAADKPAGLNGSVDETHE
jgi:hypothetical protein